MDETDLGDGEYMSILNLLSLHVVYIVIYTVLLIVSCFMLFSIDSYFLGPLISMYVKLGYGKCSFVSTMT